MDYTKALGNITELLCISKFIEMGFDCSIPYGDCCKYDFIADLGNKLIRVQCKSSKNPQRKDGTRDVESIMFSCVAQTTNTKKTVRHKYTEKDIDYFATYWEGNVYLVSVKECSTTKTLRFSPPLNGQGNYNRAEDYLIENVLGRYQSEKFLTQKTQSETLIRLEREKSRLTYICALCGTNLVHKEGGICHDCFSFNQRRAVRPSREELKKLIRTKPFTTIGKDFGVTDQAIRKWCKAVNLPTKKTEIKKYTESEWEKI